VITVINYGLGNIEAFANIYKRLNIPVNIADNADQMERATKIIFPGVGAFDWAMDRLNESGMRACLDSLVLEKKCPVLGICVGMQMMARQSDEGKTEGLGWIDAEVKKLDELASSEKVQIPHMGWNDVLPKKSDCIFNGIVNTPRFYFLHSYYFLPKKADNVLAVTDYNGQFSSAVRSDNIFGVQFHPEKSHQWGITLLKNFAEL